MADIQQPKTSLQSIQAVLEIGTKLVAFTATLCVALSVLFDWGYLTALELTFSEVPTSLTDHARSAILWLPLAAATFPLAVILNLFFDRSDTQDILDAENKGEDISTYVKNEVRRARWSLAIFTVVCFLLWLALGYRARSYLFLGTITLWVLIVVRATPFDYLGFRLGVFLRSGLLVPPILAFVIYTGGYNSGREGIAPDQKLGTIIVRGAEPLKANVVRSFERVVIVIDERQKILLLKPDEVIRVEKAQYVSINKGLLCEYWNIACPPVKAREP